MTARAHCPLKASKVDSNAMCDGSRFNCMIARGYWGRMSIFNSPLQYKFDRNIVCVNFWGLSFNALFI